MKTWLVIFALLIASVAQASQTSQVDKMRICTFYAAKASEYAVFSHGMNARYINVYVTYVRKDVVMIASDKAKINLVSLAKVVWDNRMTQYPISIAMTVYHQCYERTLVSS